jgi:Histone acetyltransferases subunit 3
MDANTRRKRVLAPLAAKYLGFQEYKHLLRDVNKSVEAQFAKRYKVSKSNKIKKREEGSDAVCMQALATRKKVMQLIVI